MQKRMIKKNVFSAVLLIAVAVSIGLLPTHSDVPLAAGPANLEIVSFSAPPTARKGNDIAGEVTLTIRNGGTTDITGNFYVGFYLSSDAAITRADRLLVKGRKTVLSIPAGATSSVAIDSLRIPMSAFLGGGFIGVIVDEFDHVAESSDTDNAASSPIIISTTKPDPLVWIRQFGTLQQDHVLGLAALDSTSLFVAGKTMGVLPGQTSGGISDGYLRKYDANGTEIWTRQFGTAMTDRVAAVVTNSSAVYIAGSTEGALPAQTNAGGLDAFVSKYDLNGIELWTRQFGTTNSEEATGIAHDATGIYVAGFTLGVLSGQSGAGGSDAFVRKYALDGTEVWTRQFGSAGEDKVLAVSVDAGAVYVVGSTSATLVGQVSAGAGDGFVRKYDTNGNELWTRQFGSAGNDDVFAVAVDASGLYLAGRTGGVLTGQSSAGGIDAFLQRRDLAGGVVWTRQFGTAARDEACAISVSVQGVCASGFTGGSLPGHVSAGGEDPFLIVYDAAGNEIMTRQFGDTTDDRSLAIASAPGGIHLAGFTSGTLPGQTSGGLDDAFTVFDDDDDDDPDEDDERNLKVVAFAGPATAVAGDVIGDQISLTIINSSVDKIIRRDFSIGLYISPDTSITLGDLLLTDGRVTVTDTMQINEVRVITFPATAAIPLGAPTGNVFLGVVLDEFNDIEEEHLGAEDDNTAFVPIALNTDTDTDGDGVLDSEDLCPLEDASFFDRDGDGCLDDILSARHLEYWPPEDLPLPYVIHENGAPGISDLSDFTAIQAGMDVWSLVPGAEVSVLFQGTVPQADAQALDGINLVTFEDPDFVFPAGVLAVGISTSFLVPTEFGGVLARPGQIVDTDMIFNPTKSFRTATAGSGTDIEGIAGHEAGHMLGISHSAVQTSTMFFVLPPGTDAASLEAEDESMILRSYPSAAALATGSRLTGAVRDGRDLSPVPGVIVYVISVATGDTVACDYTLPPTGTFSFLGLADGDYFVGFHPLNGTSPIGFIAPQNINQLIFDNAVTLVVPEFWDVLESKNDDPLARDPVSLVSGMTTNIEIITNVDETGPTVTEASPGDNSLNIAIDAAVLVSFSEAIESGSIQGNFALTDTATSQFITGNAAVLQDDSTLAFLPSGNLSFDTVYKLELGTGLTDQFGNGLQGGFVLHFTTASQPPVGITNLVPTHGPVGTQVTVNGFGFESNPTDNMVEFGGTIAPVISATANQLVVEVPAGLPTGGALVTVTNVLQAQSSNTLAYTVLPVDDVAKGFEAAVVSLGALPRSTDVVPDGSRAFIATDAGASVVVVDPALADYLTHTPIAIPGGLNELAATPDGRFVFAVSRLNQTLYRINADPANGPLEVLNDELLGAVPRGLMIEPTGRFAFITTDASEIQIWDINEASATFERQIGTLVSPDPNIRAKMATNPAGDLLLALSGIGKLLVFDLDGDSLLTEINVGPDPRDVVVDGAGQRAYVADEFGFVTVVSLTSFSAITDIPTGGSLRGLAVTPAATFLYAANRELDLLDIIDLREGTPTFRSVAADISHRPNPVDVDLSPDGIFAFSLSEAEQSLVITAIGLGPTLKTLSRRAGPVGTQLVLSGADFTADSLTTVSFNGVIASPERLADSALTVTVPPGATSGPVTVLGTNPQPPVAVSNAVFFEVLGPTPAGGIRLAAKAVPAGTPQLSRALAVSGDGASVAVGGDTGEFFVLDADAASPTFNQFIQSATPLGGPLDDIVITPDSKRAYVLSKTQLLIPLVDIDRNSPTFGAVLDSVVFTNPSAIDRLSISLDGFFMLVSDPGLASVHIVDIRSGSAQENQVIASTPVVDGGLGINGLVCEMAFHPAGEFAYLAVLDDSPAAILVLDINPASFTFGEVVNTVTLPSGAPDEVPISLSFTPDGSNCLVLTTQKDLVAGPNRTVVTLSTTTAASPTVAGSQAFATGSPASDEHIHVSPRGDRVILNILGDGFSHLDIAGLPVLALLDQSAGALHASTIDFGYSPDAVRLYATSTSEDTVFVFDFSLAQNLVEVSGDSATGTINQPLPAPLVVKAVDTGTGTPSPGVAVSFTVTAGGGSFSTSDPAVNLTTQVVVTGPDGRAEASWTMGPVVGDASQTVVASALGLSGSPITFVANTVNDPDSLPLTVATIIPTDGLADVNITTSIQTTFSRSVDPLSVDTTTYFLREALTLALVPTAAPGFTDQNRKISLTPVVPLDPGKTYTVVATRGIIGALGDSLSLADASDFTTVPPPPLGLASISPRSATIAAPIVLAGTSFDPVPANNTVLFNSVVGVVTDAGVNSINIKVPVGATTGTIRVVVGADTSEARPFTVLIPAASPADDVLGGVGTGSSTRSLTITPDGTRAYGVSPDQGTVVPIDLVTLTSLPSIPVGDNPFAIVINPDGTFAYVANFLSSTVSVIDVDPNSPDFNSVVSTLVVGTNPVDLLVTPDGDRVIVANVGSSTLSIIDSDNLSETFHTVLGGVGTGTSTRSLTITPDGGRLFVGTDTGYVILDALDFGVLAGVGGGSSTRSLTITPDGTLLVVLTTEGDVLIFDITPGSSSENQVLAGVGGGTSTRSLTITPDGGFLWLVQEEADLIIIVSLNIVNSVSALEPGGIVLAATLTVVDTVITGADPADVAFDPSGTGIAVVTNAGENTVTILGVLAEVVVRPRTVAPLQTPFRDIKASIELPSGFAAAGIGATTLTMNGLVPVTSKPGFLTDLDEDGLQELNVEFDRVQFQNIVGQGDQVSVFVTGLVGGQEFSGTDMIRTHRPALIAPTSLDSTVNAGTTFDIQWVSPAFSPISAVDLWWSEDDGQNWTLIVSGAPDTGILQWFVPVTANAISARVMVILFTEVPSASTVPVLTSIGATMSEPFAINGMVPVALGSFVATQQDRAAILKWQTNVESNFKGFHVLRSDHRDFGYAPVTPELIPASGRPTGSSYEFRDETVRPNRTYYYKLQEVAESGTGEVFGPFEFTYRAQFALAQNFPNPFNPTTMIRFTLARDSQVELVIYDVAGRRVRTLVNEKRIANHYDVEWDGRNGAGHPVASGVYFYKLVAGEFTKTRKMLLLK